MANTVNFNVGTRFDSYAQFEEKRKVFEDSVFANFVRDTTRPLKISGNITQADVDRFKYRYVKFECKMAGSPRRTVALEERKRKTTSYKQGCPSFFRLNFKQSNDESYLYISAFVGGHNHLRSASLYKTLPKQRRKTIDESSDFLSRVVNIEPNIQLLQKEVASSSSNHGVVKRSDLRNYKSKLQSESFPKESLPKGEIERVVAEMLKINGATIKVSILFHFIRIVCITTQNHVHHLNHS